MLLSIVVTTYNRQNLVIAAIASALQWIDHGWADEIVVVDDCSTDGTIDGLRRIYGAEIAKGILRLIALPRNLGATGAKNAGAQAACGDWVLFLDSDDKLFGDIGADVVSALNAEKTAPVVFFRCRDSETGALIGVRVQDSLYVGLRAMLNDWPYGECLPCVRRKDFLVYPYEEAMRGFEALSYYRLAKNVGSALVSNIIVREYSSVGEDRLSSPSFHMRLSRSCLLARGNIRMLAEFASQMPLSVVAACLVRWVLYGLLCPLHKANVLMRSVMR